MRSPITKCLPFVSKPGFAREESAALGKQGAVIRQHIEHSASERLQIILHPWPMCNPPIFECNVRFPVGEVLVRLIRHVGDRRHGFSLQAEDEAWNTAESSQY